MGGQGGYCCAGCAEAAAGVLGIDLDGADRLALGDRSVDLLVALLIQLCCGFTRGLERRSGRGPEGLGRTACTGLRRFFGCRTARAVALRASDEKVHEHDRSDEQDNDHKLHTSILAFSPPGFLCRRYIGAQHTSAALSLPVRTP